MKSTYKHPLIPEDAQLFRKMKDHYISNNERIFFEKMQEKEETDFAMSNDLILFEQDNKDSIYLIRCEYEEYIVGHMTDGKYDDEYHAMTLSEALAINLKSLGYINEDLTLFEWLRKNDYAGIQYNHNFDYM